MDCDVVIVGAGHNALVCGGYLAAAGYKVILVERRHTIGGAVVTEEIIPGYKFDLGGSAHILIHHTPIVRELQLERFGLEYIDLDPLLFAPFPDGSQITIWRDLDRTCQSIAAVSPRDADAYRQFIKTWQPLARGMVRSFLEPPTAGNLFRHLVWRTGGRDRLLRLSDILRGYGQVLRQSFYDPRVQALIGWMAAQSGPPPSEPLSAPFALWQPMYHESGIKRPRGGSGMLAQSLARMIRAHGGALIAGAPVKRIVVRNGRAVGVETEGGISISARAVVSGAHIHTTLRLLPDAPLPAQARTLLERSRIGNGFGMMVRYAMRELPNYLAAPSPEDGSPGAHHMALQLICPSLAYLEAAYGDYLAGRPSAHPALIAMTFSAADPSLAPPGRHLLFLWGQYYPYALACGASCDGIGDAVADAMLAKLAEYAPNVTDAVTGRLVEHPLYLERELGLLHGNVMHLEMSVDQMFMLRPALTLAHYRGLLPGLYLTGASTHPGGGIMGAAGRNTAQVLLRDLARKAV
ncbi:MAG TPA: NAD(P)/FAD-dependent oxidoreductase [Caldilineaceae bacterium]|nr:NAD(P)/FAD-dependent oxidoreductase [Caldilineaceae bacterium]